MGACHACDFTDIWMGSVTEHHINTCPIDTLKFMLYRDDAADMINEVEKRIFEDHLNSLHPNLTWSVVTGPEGGYLDLWLMIEDGKIEWKNFSKAPPIYVGPDSCHDPAVIGAIVKGVGLRLRINSSKDEYFESSVEEAAKAFKISGYSYTKTKQDLLKFKSLDPVELIKKEKRIKKGPDKGVQAYYIDSFDPRMPHPRKLISKNYHLIQSNPHLAALFPRQNLIAGTRRGKNLQDILSPTNQAGPASGGDDGNDDTGGADPGGASGGRYNGSYHCKYHIKTSKCDVCSYMEETSFVTSFYFNRRFAIHGRNVHLPASMKKKLTWFVYLATDTACLLQYVGSTMDACSRFSSTKNACLNRKSTNTGLYKHFAEGCPTALLNGDVRHLTWTLIDFMVTSEEKLADASHGGGVACRCSECQRLKDIEDKWICRLGTFNPPNGLNTRDEIKTRSRVNFRKMENF